MDAERLDGGVVCDIVERVHTLEANLRSRGFLKFSSGAARDQESLLQ